MFKRTRKNTLRLYKSLTGLVFCFSLLFSSSLPAQSDIEKEIENVPFFTNYELFHHISVDDGNLLISYHKLNEESLAQLFSRRPSSICFELTNLNGKKLKIQLIRHEVFSDDALISDDNGNSYGASAGIHYKGTIKGEKSISAFSITHNSIAGIISTEEGNHSFAKIEESEDLFGLYIDDDFSLFKFECSVDGSGYDILENPESNLIDRRDPNCVNIHLEIEPEVVNAKGGRKEAIEYVTFLANAVITLYSNENIRMKVKKMKAWSSNCPYSGSTAGEWLSSFRTIGDELKGDLAILVVDNISGGVASLNSVCGFFETHKTGVVGINYEFEGLPQYNFSVVVFAHEIGHILGSPHTHDCVWEGGKSIDACLYHDPDCQDYLIPPEGGTIMSYCQNRSIGISLIEGFGDQPGNLIRSTVHSGINCFETCPKRNYNWCDPILGYFDAQNLSLNALPNGAGFVVSGAEGKVLFRLVNYTGQILEVYPIMNDGVIQTDHLVNGVYFLQYLDQVKKFVQY